MCIRDSFLAFILVDAALVVATPLLLRSLIDDGVLVADSAHVVRLALLAALVAIAGSLLTVVQRWCSSSIGEGLIYDLRTQMFDHVLAQPVAFFTRTQTGSLVSRVNNDVIGAQQAFTSTLGGVLGNVISAVIVVVAMFALSWQVTIVSLLLVPLFLLPARWMGRRLQAMTRCLLYTSRCV